MRLVATILCGGAGSRLWPVSRELHPKPFIRLADGQSLLQKAFLRGAGLPGVCEVVTVTNRDLLGLGADAVRAVRIALEFFNSDLQARGEPWRLQVETPAVPHGDPRRV